MLDMWVDNEPCRKVLLGGTKLGGRLFTGVFGGSWWVGKWPLIPPTIPEWGWLMAGDQ